MVEPEPGAVTALFDPDSQVTYVGARSVPDQLQRHDHRDERATHSSIALLPYVLVLECSPTRQRYRTGPSRVRSRREGDLYEEAMS